MVDKIVEGFGKISPANVADVLRVMDYRFQVLDPDITPVIQGLKLCGRAHTHGNLPFRRHEKNIVRESEENFRSGEVIVESYWGAWGLVFSMSAKSKGCEGVVVDGGCRDLSDHRRLLPEFPVFCRQGVSFQGHGRSSNPGGSHPSFSPTRFTHAYNIPVNCGGVLVNPDDLVFGDDDGVVIIPKEVEGQVLTFATRYSELEDEIVKAFEAGKSVKEAYAVRDNWEEKIGVVDWLKSVDSKVR